MESDDEPELDPEEDPEEDPELELEVDSVELSESEVLEERCFLAMAEPARRTVVNKIAEVIFIRVYFLIPSSDNPLLYIPVSCNITLLANCILNLNDDWFIFESTGVLVLFW